jgi:hypothetical protein
VVAKLVSERETCSLDDEHVRIHEDEGDSTRTKIDAVRPSGHLGNDDRNARSLNEQQKVVKASDLAYPEVLSCCIGGLLGRQFEPLYQTKASAPK